jgi:hypothetical protein
MLVRVPLNSTEPAEEVNMHENRDVHTINAPCEYPAHFSILSNSHILDICVVTATKEANHRCPCFPWRKKGGSLGN